ncbi:hypothetical protein EVAR_87770_1 [Eumeta japonica]|uniref:Uncharacterized protein n=1 Tax=Eumeta variegata TaxID=151549 RepID=A0A4C1X4W8_EUMVA|nr:hypothetical protein EVAR_87770_1 [Eumeta japonica]
MTDNYVALELKTSLIFKQQVQIVRETVLCARVGGSRPPGRPRAAAPSRRKADDMYAEREQFEKQYCALVSAAHALLDDHAPQRRRGGRLTTYMRNASSSRNNTVRSCRRLTPSWTTTRRSAVAAEG